SHLSATISERRSVSPATGEHCRRDRRTAKAVGRSSERIIVENDQIGRVAGGEACAWWPIRRRRSKGFAQRDLLFRMPGRASIARPMDGCGDGDPWVEG